MALSNDQTSFQDLFKTFLRGAGNPCPQQFAEMKIHFSDLVDLSQVNDEGFRARIFCWAASGSFDREPNSPQIKVSFSQETTAIDSKFNSGLLCG